MEISPSFSSAQRIFIWKRKKYKHDGKIKQDKTQFATNIYIYYKNTVKKKFHRPMHGNWSIGKEKRAIQKLSKFTKMMKSCFKKVENNLKTSYNVS